uniref:Uncharacterized protein n=1 Tax=Rhizophora mucronata TaxID=61149 RepID=A0A2P2PGQ4_RHIMU
MLGLFISRKIYSQNTPSPIFSFSFSP